jgi:hypothetical protein
MKVITVLGTRPEIIRLSCIIEKLIFFSTSTLEESRGDDVRYDARYWDIWQVIER